MVAREEVAGLVLEWLQRENFKDTAATFSLEAHTMLSRLTKPPERRMKDLGALLDAYVVMAQRKQQKRDLKASLLRLYPHVLPSSFKSLVKLLEDYELAYSLPPPKSTTSASQDKKASHAGAAASASSIRTAPSPAAVPVPLSPSGPVPSVAALPGGIATSTAPGVGPMPVGLPALMALMNAQGIASPPTDYKGRGRPARSKAQRAPAPLHDLIPRAPVVAPAAPRMMPPTLPPTAVPTAGLPAPVLESQVGQHRSPPQPRPLSASTSSVPASFTGPPQSSSVLSRVASLPSISVSSPPAAMPPPAVPASAAPASASVSSTTTSTTTSVTSLSPSKRKQQTPRKRKLDTTATEVIGPAIKLPRTSNNATAASASIATAEGPLPSANAPEALEEPGEALMLDDSFFELLLNSDLPEKLAEQINKNLLSEAEQKQAEEKELKRRREAAAAEAAAQAAARAEQEKDISEKKIEEIVEAIMHEPSFEALFAQWDAENLDEEGRPADEEYENIVDENEDDDLSMSEEEEEEGRKDEAAPPLNNPEEENAPMSSSAAQPASNSAASSDTVAPSAEQVAPTTSAENGGGTRSDAPKTTPPDTREQGAQESKPETAQTQEKAAEKLAAIDLEAFLNKIHGPK